MIESFGWPGALLILGYVFIERYATLEQKRALIDRYLLGVGIEEVWIHIGTIGLAALVIISQHIFWKRRAKSLEREVERLRKELTEGQGKQLGSNIRRSGP